MNQLRQIGKNIMKNFKFIKAKETKIFIFDHQGKIEKTNLYNFVMSFAEETTSPRGVANKLHIRENEESATYEVWTWGPNGNNPRIKDSGLTELEAEELIYEMTYNDDFQNSCRSTLYFYSEAEANEELAERFSYDNNISFETARHILRKQNILNSLKQKKYEISRTKDDNRESFTKEMMIDYIIENREMIQEKLQELDTLKNANEKDFWQVKANALIQRVSNNDFRILKWKEIYELIKQTLIVLLTITY